ncbi:MAG: bifunctional diaminohydroxyphosphoribosylaminopyrimidine deaminase/5-amino-6-(5-phosphoribosylamino)uracil reductase RibD [Alphaproteobacteria bacterium]|nr:bifunctional diaminohydroxyphosphoribosylaminopyrimidine deaminase/5-amino-6-(5-phosphoribosylamino)uracil reductase RibD [Alphaproteobacteria bacterium]
MQQACRKARMRLGATSPNPPVGAAALDSNGRILALAAHSRAGEDHAEMALLKHCRAEKLLPSVETLAVTLEPCNHTGLTPPCCTAIIEAGIRRVVVGIRDPNPNVTGGGCDRLRAAGIDVIEDVEAEACKRLIHAFSYSVLNRRPFITIKRAFDAYGSMIPPKGSKTFASQGSLILAHRLRKKADAILTGSGTILADNPLFTVRQVKDHDGKRRILAILDRRGRVPKEYMDSARLRNLDVIVYRSLDEAIDDLASRKVRDVLVEAGPQLSGALLETPCWAMRVDIHKGEPDRIETVFNEGAKIPFSTEGIDLEDLLPL